MTIRDRGYLRDAVANFHPGSGASDDYCKGLLVGVMSALRAGGMSFEDAVTYTRGCLGVEYRPLTTDNVPESWLPAFTKADWFK